MPRTKKITTESVHAMEPSEAAMRLNVIIKMTFGEWDQTGDDDTGGYEQTMIGEALLEIRNGLLAMAAEDAKRMAAAARAKGGA